ncbi:hypothetical protein [Sediminicoccus sp. KRV36]|uniref:hypothetical protein n=1 Tax=Sediminicoccus sp. KRV36 TaxID=3133721 RepID=UPI00200D790D|nr:hypothetical protein [Sediminicoccus rosea]UPY38586.1 hypothetical protein LHU95_07785 [Sediminicoccus rosea]
MAALLLPLAACATGELPPSVRLPPDAIPLAADPMRSAILGSAYTLGQASTPSAKLRAAALVEFMAADYRWGVRWSEYSPTTGLALNAARDEIRQAFGVAPGATPQAVTDGLFGASRALERGNEIYLPPGLFTEPGQALARLNAPPDLPMARNAANLAERELYRVESERTSGGGPGGVGGSGGAHP